MKELVIVGGGPAGLAAAIYAARAGLDFTVLERDGFGGGQITSSNEVENYPGAGRMSGFDLGQAFRDQAVELGAEIAYGAVTGIRDLGDCKELLLDGGEPLRARAVIAATGASPRKLGVPGEREFTGAGVSYCATCDGAFFRGKDTLVVGGGDTAVEDALFLSALCRSVTVALRRDVFRAAKRRADLLRSKENVTVLYKTNLTEIRGDGRVQSVVLSSPNGTAERAVDGVFLAVGVEPVSGWLAGLPLELEGGYAAAGEDCRTNIPGLLVAGDLRKKPLRQAVTAAADGANAVTSVLEYLGRT